MKKFSIEALLAALVLAAPAWAQVVEGRGDPEDGRAFRAGMEWTLRLYEQGDYEAAMPGLQKILMHPEYRKDPAFLYRMGHCLLEVDPPQRGKARSFLLRAVEEEQEFAGAYFALGRAFGAPDDEGQDLVLAQDYLLVAARKGFNVLSEIPRTPELKGVAALNSPQFTWRLLEAAKETGPINPERTDPFRIPRELVDPDRPGGRLSHREQERFVGRAEEIWDRTVHRIHADDDEERSLGVGDWTDLFEWIRRVDERITIPEFRSRLDRVRTEMEAEKPRFLLLLLEKLVREGNGLLTTMKQTLRRNDYDSVLQLFDEELAPLTERMVMIHEGFQDAADQILARGLAMRDEAEAGLEVAALGLEVLGIVLDEDLLLAVPDRRSAIIGSGTEASEGVPSASTQRIYAVGDAIRGIDELKIERIDRDGVVCIFKDRFEVDLPLKQIGEER